MRIRRCSGQDSSGWNEWERILQSKTYYFFLVELINLVHLTISRSASLARDVATIYGFFTRFNVDPVAGLHLIYRTAGVVMELASVAVSDIGEGCGTD